MVQQLQSACSTCRGEGKVINERDKCKACNAKKVRGWWTHLCMRGFMPPSSVAAAACTVATVLGVSRLKLCSTYTAIYGTNFVSACVGGRCVWDQVVTERKVLEVHITKGMRNGQKITFHGEADEAPGTVPGDIIFIVEEKVRG